MSFIYSTQNVKWCPHCLETGDQLQSYVSLTSFNVELAVKNRSYLKTSWETELILANSSPTQHKQLLGLGNAGPDFLLTKTAVH